MSLTAQPGPASTLADVLRQVVQAFSLMGDATPIQIGRHYLEHFGTGAGPKIVFVPEVGKGKIEPGYKMGRAASWVHQCDVHVRARESGDDIDRFTAAYALTDRVVSCLVAACTGKAEFGEATDDSPTKADAFGAGISFGFTYRRDISHDAARWALPAADNSALSPSPNPPPGTLSGGNTISPTTTPKE